MKKISKTSIFVFVLLFVTYQASVIHAASYYISKLTTVFSDANGRVLITWEGSPQPGPCGTNYGFVAIRATANEALKALALSIFFSGRPARIDTSGCDGTYEVVVSLYSY
jgi:hypothetical protein